MESELNEIVEKRDRKRISNLFGFIHNTSETNFKRRTIKEEFVPSRDDGRMEDGRNRRTLLGFDLQYQTAQNTKTRIFDIRDRLL